MSKSVKSEVLYPALKALVTGLFACLLAVVLWGWAVGALVGAGAALAAWLVMQVGGNGTVTSYKNKYDGAVISKPQTTRIQITGDTSSFQAGRRLDLPMSWNTLRQVALRLEADGSFSHANLAGPGKPLTRSEFECLRHEFLKRGLCYWKYDNAHSQGCKLTKSGEAVMEYFIGGDSTVTSYPLPQRSKMLPIGNKLPKAAHAHRRARGNGKEAIIDS